MLYALIHRRLFFFFFFDADDRPGSVNGHFKLFCEDNSPTPKTPWAIAKNVQKIVRKEVKNPNGSLTTNLGPITSYGIKPLLLSKKPAAATTVHAAPTSQPATTGAASTATPAPPYAGRLRDCTPRARSCASACTREA